MVQVQKANDNLVKVASHVLLFFTYDMANPWLKGSENPCDHYHQPWTIHSLQQNHSSAKTCN